jgi:hypothetical protein
MLTSALLLFVGATPSAAVQEFVAPDFTAEQRTLLTNLFAAEMRRLGVKVVTQDEVSALLGLDRQRQLLSCVETSCTAELGAALGVDNLALGRIGRLGDATTVLVKLVSTEKGTVLAESTERLTRGQNVDEAIVRAAQRLGGRLMGVEPQAAQSPSTGLLVTAAGLALAGVGCVVGGAVLQSNVAQTASSLRTAPSRMDAESFAARGRVEQGAAFGLVTGGGVALAAAVVMAVFGFSRPVQASAWVSPSGWDLLVSVPFLEGTP